MTQSKRGLIRRSCGTLFLLFLIVAGTIILLRRFQAPMQQNEGFVFGTTYHIRYKSPTDLHDRIRSVLDQVDASLSLFNKQSTLSKINRGETDKTDVMVEEVLRLALRISEETGGAFDVTVAPLVNAWGFGTEEQTTLSDAHIDSLRQFVGYRNLSLSGRTVSKSDKRVQIDCGAIAKGYAVDKVAQLLRENQVENFMIEIGGEIVVSGKNDEGESWHIGIEQPDTTNVGGALQEVVEMTDRAVATSGNYHNYYVRDGKRVSHTISPQTGRPIVHDLLSATVVAPTCAEADAYATACMVMGAEKSRAFFKNHPKLSAYFILAGNDGYVTEKIN